MTEDLNKMQMVTDIVCAYVSSTAVIIDDLSRLIEIVSRALVGGDKSLTIPNELIPAVSIKKSVTPDHIICLENGRKFRSLRRHLKAVHGMTPDEYRAKWGLPSDYPMVAPNYSKERSALAKETGLGNMRRKWPSLKK